MGKYLVLLTFIFVVAACTNEANHAERESTVEWLEGTTDDKFKMITNQFGGFSQAMVEVNYRFGEMYWAGKDQNWAYAIYQLEKLEDAINNGFKRRPGRAASAENFMQVQIPQMMDVFKDGDSELFEHQITLFIASCNSCHVKEDVEFMYVEAPQKRFSYIRKP